METPTTASRLLNVESAADYLGLRPRQLRRMAAEGRIPHVRIGRMLRFEPGQLDAWIAANRK